MDIYTTRWGGSVLRRSVLSLMILLFACAGLLATEPAESSAPAEAAENVESAESAEAEEATELTEAEEIGKDDIDILIETIICQKYPTLIKETLVDHMLDNGRQYLGRPYKFRNPRGEIMDCSNFVRYLYSMEGLTIPRTASQQAAFTTKIPLSEVQKGDLLFFKGRSLASSRVGHVGMVIEVNGDQVKMIHSSNRGIVIDDISMNYYKRRFIQAGRVAELQDSYASIRLIHAKPTVSAGQQAGQL